MLYTLKLLRVPVSVFMFALLMFIPAYFVFAQHDDGEEERCTLTDSPGYRPAIPFEITAISDNGDGTGSMDGILEHVPQALNEDDGVEAGDTVTVTYTAETKFHVQQEDATINDFAMGDIAFALGILDVENMTIEARAIVDKPLPPKFRINEVVKIDTEANTILVQSLRAVEETEETQYILISYDDDTIFNKDGEEATESDVVLGDKIHARGDVQRDSEEYFAEIDADSVLLWTELEPKLPHADTHAD